VLSGMQDACMLKSNTVKGGGRLML
jgi:hypothetical protein